MELLNGSIQVKFILQGMIQNYQLIKWIMQSTRIWQRLDYAQPKPMKNVLASSRVG